MESLLRNTDSTSIATLDPRTSHRALATRSNANSPAPALHTTVSENGGGDTVWRQMGPAQDCRLSPDVRQTSGIAASGLIRASQTEVRSNTRGSDTRRAMGTLGRLHEGTRQYFLQPTPQIQERGDAQTRFLALRRKLVSEQATRKEQMGKFLGDIRAPGRLL